MHRRFTALLLFALMLGSLLLPPDRAVAEAARPPVPVLLLHGFGGSPTDWPAIEIFEAAGYQRGESLFVPQLPNSTDHPLALLRDAAMVRGEVERVLRESGAQQVDLVGHSQGGLIARILAAGETSALVRRAVSIDAPHTGILSEEAIGAMLKAAGLPPSFRRLVPVPTHLAAGSPALLTLAAREAHFAAERSPALAIGSEWQEGVLDVLTGHDGIVPLASQLAWPGAETQTFRLGPPPAAFAGRIDPFAIAWLSPHAESQWDPAVIGAAIAYLQAPEVPPLQLGPAPEAERTDRPISRAAFLYQLVRRLGLPERLQPSPFTDLTGHWAIGYVEAARAAGLASGLTADQFGPEKPLTRAEAVTLVGRALGLAPAEGPGRFADTAGHWAEGWIESAAIRAIVQGNGQSFRPDDLVTIHEAGLIITRAIPQP